MIGKRNPALILMRMRLKFFVAGIILLGIVSCTAKRACPDWDNLKFRIASDGDPSENFSKITGNEKVEIDKGQVFSRSDIIWKDCSHFSLVIQFIKPNPYLHKGDTLKVDVLSFENDTLTCMESMRRFPPVITKTVAIR